MFGKVQTFSSIVQYVSMNREEKNNNTRKTAFGPVRCLFGVPDRNETKNLIEQELKKQKEAFFERWEIDLDNFDMCVEHEETKRKRKYENDENEVENPAKRLSIDDKLSSVCNNEVIVPRRILQPRNGLQSQITDFWTSKKSVCEDHLSQKLSSKYCTQHF